MTAVAEKAQAAGATAADTSKKPWALLTTPLVALAAGGALTLYLTQTNLTATQRETLSPSALAEAVVQHLELTLVSTVIVLAIAIPVGILLSRKGARMATPVVLALANIGQGAPAIGVIALLAVWLGIGFWTAIVSLSVYSILPALRNTLVGLQQVDPALVDAGRGIGMSAPAVLFRVELPLAIPVILAGIRTTLVLNVGIAALAAFIGAGGLGNLVVTGVKLYEFPVLVTGSVLIAILALLVDWVAAIAERYLHPKGVLPMRGAKAVVTLALAAMVTACGLEPASQFIPEVKAGPELDEFDSLNGATIVTTSKDFTEQLILGKILTLVLSAKGAEVVDNTNAKGSVNARESLLRGDADLMWEYTGTGWVNYLGHVDGDPGPDGKPVELSDADQVFKAVAIEDLEENGIFWSKPAPFNNTYAIAMTEADSKRLGVTTLDDIANVPTEEQTFCLENEFESRSDGWRGMKEAYRLDIPSSNVSIMDAGIVYSEVGGRCVFGEVFDTDGRILANNLVTLEDNKGYFPIYEPSVTIRESINKEYPQIAEMFEKIGAELSTDVMRELNSRVDVDGENPVKVAEDWLLKEGFLKQPD